MKRACIALVALLSGCDEIVEIGNMRSFGMQPNIEYSDDKQTVKKVTIRSVACGSNAARQDVREGDVLLRLNRIKIEGLSHTEYDRLVGKPIQEARGAMRFSFERPYNEWLIVPLDDKIIEPQAVTGPYGCNKARTS